MTLTAEIWELKYSVIVHASEMTPLASLAHSHFGKSLLGAHVIMVNNHACTHILVHSWTLIINVGKLKLSANYPNAMLSAIEIK